MSISRLTRQRLLLALLFFAHFLLLPHHVPCDFVDGEDAPMALQSLLLPLPSPFQGWLGAAALDPEEQEHDQEKDAAYGC